MAQPPAYPKIFLSYARGDDEPFVARLHEALKDHGFDVWWDRKSMPSRSLTFHQEIRDAIAAHDRLMLVIGPRAITSDYVSQEWRFADDNGKVVTPILRLGDYPLVPPELKLLHVEDFRADEDFAFHLANLVRQLSEPPPPLGKLIAVPSLPPHYLDRPERRNVLRDALPARWRYGQGTIAVFAGCPPAGLPQFRVGSTLGCRRRAGSTLFEKLPAGFLMPGIFAG